MKTPLAILALAAITTARAADVSQYNVVWDLPSKSAIESMPIGNGDIGLNVWVEPSGDLVFFIGKTDAWDENLRLLKLGRVRVKFSPALTTTKGLRQELRLRDGMMIIETPQASVRVWVDANHPVIQVDAVSPTGQPLEARASLEIWRTEKRPLGGKEYSSTGYTSLPAISYPDTVLPRGPGRIGWYHRNIQSPWLPSLKLQNIEEIAKTQTDPILNRTMGAILRGENFVSASDTELKTANPAKELSLRVHVLTQITDTPQQWLAALEKQANATDKLSAARRLREHCRWWNAFWERSWICASGDASAELVTRGYTLQRWVNACGGRGEFPIKFNGSIFVVDNASDADYRTWGGGYWFQNTRLPYWSMVAAGDYDLMMPLFTMYMRALPARKLATKTYYKHDGAFFPETMSFWGNYLDQGSMGYGTDRGKLPDGMTQNQHIRYYWQGGLELTAIMFRYYKHTGDEEFLRDIALPFAHEIVTFYDQHYKRDEQGKLRIHPGYALEDIWDCTNPAPDIAGLTVTLSDLIEFTRDAARRKQYQRLLSELPDLPTLAGADGKTRFAPAEPGWRHRKNNSEKPELYAVFPYRLFGIGLPKLDWAREAWKYSNKSYLNWKQPAGWSQDPIFLACLGYTHAAKAEIVRRAKMKYPPARFPAFWTPNFDWMPDQDHGAVNNIALQTMLLQTADDRLLLLPAWPKEWNVDFKLHGPLGTTIEGRYETGEIKSLKVTPQARRKDVVIMEAQ